MEYHYCKQYQADACHLEFGKYTMFTIYGIGANNNTFPVAMGMSNQFIVDNYIGGDYARWSKAYPWMVRYLSSRYEGILGYGGLARFVDQFPRFHDAIERYVRTEKAREQVDGTFHLILGV